MANNCGRVGKCRVCNLEMKLKKKFFGFFRYRACVCGYSEKF